VDGRYYLPKRIRWFIDRDKPVDTNLIISFSRRVHFTHPGVLLHDIVRFDGELFDRPDKLDNDDSVVCRVSCNLEPTLRKQKIENVQIQRKYPFVKAVRYLHVSYEIWIRIYGSGLIMELSVKGEKQRKVGELNIDWTRVANKLKLKLDRDFKEGDSEIDSESGSVSESESES
jgi:hypothetical protein